MLNAILADSVGGITWMQDVFTELLSYHAKVLPSFATYLHVFLCRLSSRVCTLAWEQARALWPGESCMVQLGLR